MARGAVTAIMQLVRAAVHGLQEEDIAEAETDQEQQAAMKAY